MACCSSKYGSNETTSEKGGCCCCCPKPVKDAIKKNWKSGKKRGKYCHEKYSKLGLSIISIMLYLWNMWNNIALAHIFYSNNDEWWFGITVLTTVLPMLIAGIICIIIVIQNSDEQSINCEELCLWTLITILFSPFIPFSILVWKIYNNIINFPNLEDIGNIPVCLSIKNHDFGDKIWICDNKVDVSEDNNMDRKEINAENSNGCLEDIGNVPVCLSIKIHVFGDDSWIFDNKIVKDEDNTMGNQDNNTGNENFNEHFSLIRECKNVANTDDDPEDIDGFMKLCQTILENVPDLLLQTYIIFQYLHANKEITYEQWLKIISSLISLSFSISTNSLFNKSSLIMKFVFMSFGMITVASRFMLSCVFSFKHKLLIFVPIFTELIALMITWIVIKYCRFFTCLPLTEFYCSTNIGDAIFAGMIWLLTVTYNCFTVSGLIVSLINLVFAVGGYVLDMLQPFSNTGELVTLIVLIISIISCVINVILVVVPQFQTVKEGWLDINDNGKRWPVKKVISSTHNIYLKHKSQIIILTAIMYLLMYSLDFYSDMLLSYLHYIQGDLWWGFCSVVYTILPMVFSSIILTPILIDKFQVLKKSLCSIFLFVILVITCTPIFPFSALVWNVVAALRGYDPGSDPIGAAASHMKLAEAMLESYPALQLNIYMSQYSDYSYISVLWWMSVVTSSLSFSFSISTNSYLFEKASRSSKFILFVVGLLTCISRILVCFVYSLTSKYLWFLPFGTLFIVSITLWGINRRSLAEFHFRSKLTDRASIILTWMLAASYNGFTYSGLIMSTLNLLFAVGGHFLPIPQTWPIPLFPLAAVSWVVNLFLATAKCCKRVREDWLAIGDDGRGMLY